MASCAPQTAAPTVEPPPRPQRVVSLDYCADQFVLRLADRAQIAGVSRDAQKDFSFMRAAAIGVPQVRSTAEDVLTLTPDLVVRSHGGGPNVAALMSRAHVRVAQLSYAEDFDGVRANLRSIADALGHPERADEIIAEMDARLAAVTVSPRESVSALYMTPAGVTTGKGSLVHALLRAAGLENFEQQPGWRPIPLERLASERPDMIAAAFFGVGSSNPDSWSAGRHPIAQRQLKERPTVQLDGAWTACGGWFLMEAVEAMAAQRKSLEARHE